MVSAKQTGAPVFKKGDEQIVMANPVLLFEMNENDNYILDENICDLILVCTVISIPNNKKS